MQSIQVHRCIFDDSFVIIWLANCTYSRIFIIVQLSVHNLY